MTPRQDDRCDGCGRNLPTQPSRHGRLCDGCHSNAAEATKASERRMPVPACDRCGREAYILMDGSYLCRECAARIYFGVRHLAGLNEALDLARLTAEDIAGKTDAEKSEICARAKTVGPPAPEPDYEELRP